MVCTDESLKSVGTKVIEPFEALGYVYSLVFAIWNTVSIPAWTGGNLNLTIQTCGSYSFCE